MNEILLEMISGMKDMIILQTEYNRYNNQIVITYAANRDPEVFYRIEFEVRKNSLTFMRDFTEKGKEKLRTAGLI